MVTKTMERAREQITDASVYLLVGGDVAERSKWVAQIQSRYVDPGFADWCVETVDGLEATGHDVLELVSTPPFIGERRVVIVRSAQGLADEEALVPYAESPAHFSVLVLIADSIDKRKKLYQAIRKHGKVVEFEAPATERLPGVIVRMAEERNFTLDPAALSLVVERSGDDMNRVKGEIEKLSLYAGDGGRISLKEADLLVSRGQPTLGQYAIFDFVDALAEGQVGVALRRLDELLRCGEPPLLVLTMIGRQFRLLLAAIAWQGGPPSELAKAMGLRSEYPARKALGQARRWKVDQVARALEACSECDVLMKRGMDGRRALEALTVRLACRIDAKT